MSKNNNSKERYKKKPKLDLADETKKGIIAVLVFLLALISLLSAFDVAGIFGQYFFKFGVMIFGNWGYFLLPLAMILLGVAMLLSLHEDVYGTTFIGIGIFLISLLGLFQLILTNRLVQGYGGGYLGYFMVWPLLKAFGVYASYIILLTLVLISVLIIFNVSLLGLIKKLFSKKEEVGPAVINPEDGFKKDSSLPYFKVKGIEEEIKQGSEGKDNVKEVGRKGKELEFFPASRMALKDYKLPPLDLLDADWASQLRAILRPMPISSSARFSISDLKWKWRKSISDQRSLNTLCGRLRASSFLKLQPCIMIWRCLWPLTQLELRRRFLAGLWLA